MDALTLVASGASPVVVATDESSQKLSSDAAVSTDFSTVPLRPCIGIPNERLQTTSIPPSELPKLMAKYDYIDKRWHSRGCKALPFAPGKPSDKSCDRCWNMRTDIRKKNYPGLWNTYRPTPKGPNASAQTGNKYW